MFFNDKYKKKFQNLAIEHRDLELKYTSRCLKFQELLRLYNNLIDRINQHGGESLFSGNNKNIQFSESELRDILILCHPDKHCNSSRAHNITTKVNQLRSSI